MFFEVRFFGETEASSFYKSYTLYPELVYLAEELEIGCLRIHSQAFANGYVDVDAVEGYMYARVQPVSKA